MGDSPCPVSTDGSTGAVTGHPPGVCTTPRSERSPERRSGAGTVPSKWPRMSYLEFAPTEIAPGCGRLHAKNVLLEWGLAGLVEDAELLVSELLTNAYAASVVIESKPTIALRLLCDYRRFIIEVWDSSPLAPREVGSPDESGRGLLIVEALSRNCGVRYPRPGIKVVWAEISVDH